MPFRDELVVNGYLVQPGIRSPNYVEGDAGWTVNADGSAEFNELTVNGGQILINNANGDTVASINEEGNASFQDLSVVGSPSIGGKDFQTEIIDPLPRGLKAYGFNTTYQIPVNSVTEQGLLEVAADLDDRTYNLYGQFNGSMGGGTGNNVGLNVRYEYAPPGSTAAKPSLASTLLYQTGREVANILVGQTFSLNIDTELPNGPGNYRFLLSCLRLNGTGGLNTGTSIWTPIFFSIKDMGPAGLNTGVLNNGGGGGGAPVQTYTANHFPTWSRAYNGNGSPGSFSNPNSLYQGYNQSDSNGIRRSMIGYDWATIQSQLSGATISYVAWTAYFAHWYPNSGGACRIGYHNYAGGSAPASYQTVGFIKESAGWPKPGLRTVDLTSTGLGTQLQTGNAKGITIGDGASSAQVYYGYANGAGMSNPPYLTITYTK